MGRAYSSAYSLAYGPPAQTIVDTIVLPLPVNCQLAGDEPIAHKTLSFSQIVKKGTTTNVKTSSSGLFGLGGDPPSFTTTTKGLRH